MPRVALLAALLVLGSGFGATAAVPAGADLKQEARAITEATRLAARDLGGRRAPARRLGVRFYRFAGCLRIAAERAPRRAYPVIQGLFTSSFQDPVRSLLPALDRFRNRLGRLALSDPRLRDGALGWAQAIFLLRRFPRTGGDLCGVLRRWQRRGFARRLAPLTDQNVRRIRLLSREQTRAARRLDRASRQLRHAGVPAPDAATFALDGLLAEGGVELLGVPTRLSACRSVTARSRPRFVDAEFVAAGLLDVLAVLRRPQRSEDRIARADLPSDARAVQRGSERLLLRRGAKRYHLFAGQAPAASLLRRSCLRRLAPAQRRWGERQNADERRRAARSGLWTASVGPEGDPGAGSDANGLCCVSSIRELRRRAGLFFSQSGNGPIEVTGLAPDGVARATLVVRGGRGLRARVRENFFLFRVRPGVVRRPVDALLLQDRRGRVVRRIDLPEGILGFFFASSDVVVVSSDAQGMDDESG